jgi:hypothetical protein
VRPATRLASTTLPRRRIGYCVCSSGQTSTTPWATAQGVRETISTASSTLSASIAES